MPNVAIQGVGVVQFPDNMAPDAIQHAIETDILPKASAEAAPKPSPSANLLPGEGALRQFAHGASFGFDAKLAGLVSAATGGDYQSARDAYEREADAYRVENPKTSFALNLAGGVASGTGIASTVGKLAAAGRAATAAGGVAAPAEQAAMNVAQTFASGPKWWQLAKIGGAAGAAQGVGEAQDSVGDYAKGIGGGAAAGAVLGAVLPPVVGAGVKALDATVGRAGRYVVNALRTPEGQGDRALLKALQLDGITPTEFTQKLRDLGPESMPADVGPNTRALADVAVQIPGRAKTVGVQNMTARAQGAGDRVMGSLTQNMGVPSTNADEAIQQLHGNMRAISPEYEASLDSAKVPLNEKLIILLKDKKIQDGVAAARSAISTDSTISQLEGKGSLDSVDRTLQGFTRTPETMDPLTNTPVAGTGSASAVYSEAPSLRAWDYVRRGLDAIVDKETDPVTGKMSSLGRQYYLLRSKLVNELDTAAPDYAAARGRYADEKEAEAAIKLGGAFLHDQSEVTARQIGEMSPAAQQYAKLGAARAVQDKIFNAPDTGMAYEQFLNRRENVRRLQAVFGEDRAGFDAFMKDLANEVEMGKTFRSLAGSQTAGRQFAREEFGLAPAQTLPITKEGWGRKLQLMLTEPSDEVKGQLAKLLFEQDPASKDAIGARLQAIGPSLNRRVLPPNTAQAAAFLLGKTAGGR